METIIIENIIIKKNYLKETLTVQNLYAHKHKIDKILSDLAKVNDSYSYHSFFRIFYDTAYSFTYTFILGNLLGLRGDRGRSSLVDGSILDQYQHTNKYVKVVQYYSSILKYLKELNNTIMDCFPAEYKFSSSNDNVKNNLIQNFIQNKSIVQRKLQNIFDRIIHEVTLLFKELDDSAIDKTAQDEIVRNDVTYEFIYDEQNFKKTKDMGNLIIQMVESILHKIRVKKLKDIQNSKLHVKIDFQESDAAFVAVPNAEGVYNITYNKVLFKNLVTQKPEMSKEYIIAHELGHHYYYNILEKSQRDSWEDLFENSKIAISISDLDKFSTVVGLSLSLVNKNQQIIPPIKNVSSIINQDTDKILKLFNASFEETISRLKDQPDKYFWSKLAEVLLEHINKPIFKSKINQMKGFKDVLKNLTVMDFIYNFITNILGLSKTQTSQPSNIIKFGMKDFFVSSYGETNPAEFYAETFANYVTEEEKIPDIVLKKFLAVSKVSI